MITADRFIVRATEHDAWIQARAGGVTATQVSGAATESGFALAAGEIAHPSVIVPNDYMRFGSNSEADIMRYAHETEGILPSDWLIAGENPAHLCTPDGLSLDHLTVAEAKTTGTDWAAPPIKYRRQAQWQMWCTGAQRCLLLWNLRVPDDRGGYYLGWIQPKTLWIERDPKMIAELVAVADRLLALKGA